MSQVELVLLQVLKLDKDLGRIFTLDMAASGEPLDVDLENNF